MPKGKRPTAQKPSPWSRWVVVLAGLVAVAVVVWLLVRPSADESDAAPEAIADASSPQPLGGAEGPTVEAAASLENVPPDSLVSAGPDAPSGVDISNDPRRGGADAAVTIVEFSDFQCPHCKTFHEQIFPALQRLYGDQVRWIFVNRFFPVGHQYAEEAAIGGECALRQGKFWEYADYVFANQERLGDGVVDRAASEVGLDEPSYTQCLTGLETASEVAADQAEAVRLGVGGTPYFLVNGHEVLGAQPVGVFNEVIAPYFEQ
ncbi:MAG: DsbA family protein [Gemmatimonadota bacterium]